jgi:hypothetical protein
VSGRGRWVVKGAAFVVLALAFLAAFSWVVMSLWNWLVPALFHGPVVQYWQAVGLLVLSRILFGGLRGRGGWHGHWRQRMWRERWANLTPQERERMREHFQRRCGRERRDDTPHPAPPPP